FDDNGNMITPDTPYATYEEKAKATAAAYGPGVFAQFDSERGEYFVEKPSSYGTSSRQYIPKETKHVKNQITELRANSPIFEGMSDAQVYRTLLDYKESI